MTGPEPAGGSDDGAGTSWPQMRVVNSAPGASGGAAGGCCANTGAAHSTTKPRSVFTRVYMKEKVYRLLDVDWGLAAGTLSLFPTPVYDRRSARRPAGTRAGRHRDRHRCRPRA